MSMLGLFAIGFVLAFGIMYKAFPTLDRATLTKQSLPGFSIALPKRREGERTEGLSGR